MQCLLLPFSVCQMISPGGPYVPFSPFLSFPGDRLFFFSPCRAELQIDSVVPAVARVGENLTLTLTGSDFTADTRVAISLDSLNRSQITGTLALPQPFTQDVAVAGELACVAQLSTVCLIDISDRSTPRLRGVVEVGFLVREVRMGGSTVYVTGDEALTVIDADDPNNPRVLGTVAREYGGVDFALQGNRAAVVDSSGLFTLLNVADPLQPLPYGSVALGQGRFYHHVAVDGNMAYVAYSFYETGVHATNGLLLIDISDAAAPVVAGSFVSDGGANFSYADMPWDELAVSGGTAFVLNAFVGDIHLVDVTDPALPSYIGQLDTPGQGVTDFRVADDVLFVVNGWSEQLKIYDVSDPQQPVVTGEVLLPQTADFVEVTAATVIVGTNYGGLFCVEANDPRRYPAIGVLAMPSARDMAVAGAHAFVATGGGLSVLDISTPTNPSVIAALPTEALTSCVLLSGETLFLGGSDVLYLLDVRRPQQPTIISSIPLEGEAMDLHLAGALLFVAVEHGLAIIDVSDPAQPLPLGGLPMIGQVRAVAVADDVAFVAVNCTAVEGCNPLQVVDINDPEQLVVIGEMDLATDWLEDVEATGSLLYAVDRQNFFVFDGVDPLSPVNVATLVLPGIGRDISLAGERAYVAAANGGVQVIDIADPLRPLLVGAVDVRGNAVKISPAGDWVYGLDGHFAGMSFVALPLPVEGEAVIIHDPTSLTVTLPAALVAGPYDIRIFNAADTDTMAGAVTAREREKPVVGDWDGDGRTTIGIFADQTFFLDMDNDGRADAQIAWRYQGDIPVIGDWDGNGIDDLGVFSAAARTFFLDTNRDGRAEISVTMGRGSDLPVAGDWDGDGCDDVGLYRPMTRRYYLDDDEDGVADRALSIGRTGDVPLVGDWNGDGIDSIGVFRPSLARFYLDDDNDGLHDQIRNYGTASDTPLYGDWDGDGIIDIGIHRQSTGCFSLDYDYGAIRDESICWQMP